MTPFHNTVLAVDINETSIMVTADSNSTMADQGPDCYNGSCGHSATTFNQHYHVFKMIETYFVPLTCVVGLVGNTLAVKTFLHKDLKRHSCSVFLITKSVSDILFLLNLSLIYISGGVMFPITTVYCVCKILIFVTYISGFLSVWSVIFVSLENFVRIRYPFEVKRVCKKRNAELTVVTILLIAICIYHVPLWISDQNCVAVQKYTGVTETFVLVDTLVTLIIPSILLSVLIIAIISKVIRFQEKHVKESNRNLVPACRVVGKSSRKSHAQIAAVCKMLLAVSLTFFFLTVPSHIVRIKVLISSFTQGYSEVSDTEGAIQGISQLCFYSSMSVNLFIFLIFGDNFRKVFVKVVFRRESQSSYNTSQSGESRNVVVRELTEPQTVDGSTERSRSSRSEFVSPYH